MSNELSAHERLQRYIDARRLLLWAAGLEKHNGAPRQLEDALSEMRIAAALGIFSCVSPENHAEGRRAMDALTGFMIGTQHVALWEGPYRSRITVGRVREYMAQAVAEWWLGPKAASELHEEVMKLKHDCAIKKDARRRRRLASRAGSSGRLSAAL